MKEKIYLFLLGYIGAEFFDYFMQSMYSMEQHIDLVEKYWVDTPFWIPLSVYLLSVTLFAISLSKEAK